MDAPLSGVTIIDLTRVLAGPYCTMVLADLGARVIKVERPGGGDDARQIGPFVGNGPEAVSAYFASVNRNKQSITLDLNDSHERSLLLELIEGADVLVENFSPGTMAKWGLDPAVLRRRFPSLVYASISGFGQTGPMRAAPAYDVIVQAASGLMSITGEPGGSPLRAGISIADLAAGLFAAIGIQAALIERARSGQGAIIDIAMLDCQVALLENAIARFQVDSEPPRPNGSRHPSIAPFAIFRVRDGWIAVAAGNNLMFERLCTALDAPFIAGDERFATNDLRCRHIDALTESLEQILRKRDADYWISALGSAGIPCGPVNGLAEVLAHPQLRDRGMLTELEVENGASSKLLFAGSPIKFTGRAPVNYAPAPRLGEHRDAVLNRLIDRQNQRR